MLCGLVVAASMTVLSAAPSQAANTASEALVDTDDDGIADSREFAGSNRYKTSIALAERLVYDNGTVDTVLIASGVSQVDAVASAGLAGHLNAAILLTTPTRLHADAATFITDNGVGNVYILGGSAAVSREVEDAIAALDPVQQVTRLGGADRYETATVLATEIGGGGVWCGSDLRTALIVNGAGANYVDAVIAGPLAAALELPILLTDGTSLSDAAVAYFEANTIDQVVIIGGTDSVDEPVAEDLSEMHGVTEVVRIAGTTDAGTAVEIANVIAGCLDDNDIDFSTVALVNGEATSDGVTAAPVLANGLDAQGMTPLLLVGSGASLPNETGTYLSSTPEMRDGERTHLSILAIGGTDVVSESVMAAAVEAADSGGAIGVEIVGGDADSEGRRAFEVAFDADIDTAKASDKSLFRIVEPGSEAGRRLFAHETVAVGYRKVTVTAGDPPGFVPGTTLVVLGDTEVGTAGDRRALMTAKFKLPSPPRDTRAPAFTVAAFAGTQTFYVILDEENLADDEELGPDEITITRSSGAAPTITGIDEVTGRKGLYTVQSTDPLAANDEITIESDAVRDATGRQSRRVRYIVRNPDTTLKVASILVGPANRDAEQASAKLFDDEVIVTTKATGKAGGASGNGWRIVGYDDRETGYDHDAAPVVMVTVFTGPSALIQFEIDAASGDVTQAELAAALESNSDFGASFEVSFSTDFENGVAHPTTTTNVTGAVSAATFADGQSAVAVKVVFSDPISGLAVATGNPCNSTDLHSEAGCDATQLAASFVGATTPTGVERSSVAQFADASQAAVLIVYTSNSESGLPVAGAAYSVAAAAANSYGENVVSEAATGRLRRDYRLIAEIPEESN